MNHVFSYSPRPALRNTPVGIPRLALLTLTFCALIATARLQASDTLPAPAPLPAGDAVRPVTITDVVAMSRSGLDDQVMINLIRQNGMASALSTAELISLRQHGVSNAVIAAMQSAAPPVVRSTAPTIVQPSQPTYVRVYEPAPVVIHRYSYPQPCLVPSYSFHFGKHWHHHHSHPRRSGTSVGFGVTFR